MTPPPTHPILQARSLRITLVPPRWWRSQKHITNKQELGQISALEEEETLKAVREPGQEGRRGLLQPWRSLETFPRSRHLNRAPNDGRSQGKKQGRGGKKRAGPPGRRKGRCGSPGVERSLSSRHRKMPACPECGESRQWARCQTESLEAARQSYVRPIPTAACPTESHAHAHQTLRVNICSRICSSNKY